MKQWLFPLAALSMVGWGALSGAAAQPGSEGEAVAARGVEVYNAYYCGVCHALPAAGTRGAFGPSHAAMGVIAAARVQDPGYTGEATDAAGYLRESIVDPAAYIVPGYAASNHAMPAFTTIPEADLEALVSMLLAQ